MCNQVPHSAKHYKAVELQLYDLIVNIVSGGGGGGRANYQCVFLLYLLRSVTTPQQEP